MENKVDSYTSANAYPVKVLMRKDKAIDNRGNITPLHVQINPTNVCNLNCPFCSCANRAKKEEMPFGELIMMMRDFKKLGCDAVTITGGGEPLLHPNINELIKYIAEDLNIKVGLVTNGTQFAKLKTETYQYITWCRISSGDYREFTPQYEDQLKKAVTRGANVDWAFSHVLSSKPNYDTIGRIVDFANKHYFTHVRIVSDLLDLDKIPDMSRIQKELHKRGIMDDLVVYQGRKDYVRGRKDCLISLLKPVIGADGYIYPCCGSQYALDIPGLDYEKTMRLGHWSEMGKIFKRQKGFDGSICVKCYYDNYNDLLGKLRQGTKHIEFI